MLHAFPSPDCSPSCTHGGPEFRADLGEVDIDFVTDREPRAHLVVVREPFARAIIDGTKTLESRLSQTRQRPFASVAPGDCLYIKLSGGPVIAASQAAGVRYFADLTPSRIRRLRQLFGEQVGAPACYWNARRSARYATFIALHGVRAFSRSVRVPRLFGAAWVVLDAESPAQLTCV